MLTENFIRQKNPPNQVSVLSGQEKQENPSNSQELSTRGFDQKSKFQSFLKWVRENAEIIKNQKMDLPSLKKAFILGLPLLLNSGSISPANLTSPNQQSSFNTQEQIQVNPGLSDSKQNFLESNQLIEKSRQTLTELSRQTVIDGANVYRLASLIYNQKIDENGKEDLEGGSMCGAFTVLNTINNFRIQGGLEPLSRSEAKKIWETTKSETGNFSTAEGMTEALNKYGLTTQKIESQIAGKNEKGQDILQLNEQAIIKSLKQGQPIIIGIDGYFYEKDGQRIWQELGHITSITGFGYNEKGEFLLVLSDSTGVNFGDQFTKPDKSWNIQENKELPIGQNKSIVIKLKDLQIGYVFSTAKNNTVKKP